MAQTAIYQIHQYFAHYGAMANVCIPHLIDYLPQTLPVNPEHRFIPSKQPSSIICNNEKKMGA